MKFFKFLIMASLLLTAAFAESDSTKFEPVDMTGSWKVLLENSYTRKQITFRIEQKDGRMRGKMHTRETEAQELDGRQTEDGEVLFWSTYRSREGITTESSFKGRWEGTAVVGKARYFDKPYTFRAERAEDSK